MRNFIAALLLAVTCASADAQTASQWRLRGTVQSADLPRMLINERGGQLINLTLADNLLFQEVVPISADAIQQGAFVGTAATPRPDGTLQSIEVVVFAESARGSGEGHYPWDLRPQASMTNATIANLEHGPDGRRLTLRYKDGEKNVVVPLSVPVVTFKPGSRELIVPGAKVFVVAEARDGFPVATRLVIGRDGFEPPM